MVAETTLFCEKFIFLTFSLRIPKGYPNDGFQLWATKVSRCRKREARNGLGCAGSTEHGQLVPGCTLLAEPLQTAARSASS